MCATAFDLVLTVFNKGSFGVSSILVINELQRKRSHGCYMVKQFYTKEAISLTLPIGEYQILQVCCFQILCPHVWCFWKSVQVVEIHTVYRIRCQWIFCLHSENYCRTSWGRQDVGSGRRSRRTRNAVDSRIKDFICWPMPQQLLQGYTGTKWQQWSDHCYEQDIWLIPG